MANYKERNELPSAAEFGQWRSRLANRGYSQDWITRNFGTGNNKSRGVNDSNGRHGYLTDQAPQQVVNLVELAVYLVGQGWEAEPGLNQINVGDIPVLKAWLMMCDYSSLNDPPLENDLCMGMQAQGLCTGGCN